MRNPIDSFTVSEVDSTDECWLGIYTIESIVSLVVSRNLDGDVEVSLREQEAQRLIAALQSAIDVANGKSGGGAAPNHSPPRGEGN